MSEYNEQVLKLIGVIQDKPFLFPSNMQPRMKLNLYLDWFEKHNQYEFCQMPAMAHFSPDLLDKFKNNIVWTGFIPTDGRGGAHALHTIVQVNKDYHIVLLYAQEDSQVSVIATLYIKDTREYVKFLEDNYNHIIRKSIGGFVPFSANSQLGFNVPDQIS